LRFSVSGIRRDEFDGGFPRWAPLQLREEDAAQLGAAQPLEEGKSPIDGLPYPVTMNCRYIHDVNHSISKHGEYHSFEGAASSRQKLDES
jgi:hypothetical protein